jgi:peptidoglycan/xylan/chitin deacetylase (PgdA/CDA1 family)
MLKRANGLAARGAQRLGLSRVLRRLHQRDLVVLNYHGVVPDEYALNPLLHPNVIGVSEFSRQMALVSRFFDPIRASELRSWQAGRGRAVLVTFDDGYRNNLTHAAPVLERFGISALITICPGYVGQKRMLWPDEVQWRALWWPEKMIPTPPYREQRVPDSFPERLALAIRVRECCKRLRYEQLNDYLGRLRKHPLREPVEEVHALLSWDQVLTLKSRGFNIGSHTLEHPILSQLPRDKLLRELRDSKSIIERRTGCECAFFAYPNGGAADVSPSVVEEVRRAGYQFAFTVTGRVAAPEDEPLLLDRIYVPGLISAAEFDGRISGLYSALKRCLFH